MSRKMNLKIPLVSRRPHGSPAADPRGLPPKSLRGRDIYIPTFTHRYDQGQKPWIFGNSLRSQDRSSAASIFRTM
jgi:hypothetical protein